MIRNSVLVIGLLKTVKCAMKGNEKLEIDHFMTRDWRYLLTRQSEGSEGYNVNQLIRMLSVAQVICCNCNAWFSSTCYHSPPRQPPGQVQLFVPGGGELSKRVLPVEGEGWVGNGANQKIALYMWLIKRNDNAALARPKDIVLAGTKQSF